MIERFIYTALTEGFQTLKANNDFLHDLFVTLHGLSEKEFKSIKLLLETKTPKVIHGYAHADESFPLCSIVLDSEQETDEFLGFDAGMVDDPKDPDYRDDILSGIWQHNHSVLIYAEHPDAVLYYYEMAKSSLLAAHEYFVDRGMHNITLSGMDLAPDPRYIPAHLFLRRLSIKSQREFQRLETVQRAFKVQGIAVDSSGSTSDVGGVPTNVKPYAAEGD